ncbi:MAG: hypothetical protein RI947_235 [Candidatus Parcubacteria bacterium]|jgi:LmbE family N-acetylglucosaminyl deacetylase
MRVLIIAPHPDDDIIGCGGSIAKHIAHGNDVGIVFMTSGDVGSGHADAAKLRTIREAEAKNGAEALGAKTTFFLRFIDGSVVCDAKSITKLAETIAKYKPDLVYIPHKKDNHKDHIATHTIALESIMMAEGMNNTSSITILAYEVWTPITDVSYIEDITEYIELKVNALQKHTTQVQNTRFDEAVRGLNKYRGVMKGKGGYSECFEVLRIQEIIPYTTERLSTFRNK